jgi:hypothetical protein
MYEAASDDEPTQRDGLVSIVWPSLELRDVLVDPAQQRKNTALFEGMPLRSTGLHICLPGDDPVSKVLQALLLIGFGKDLRRTIKIHSGKSPVSSVIKSQGGTTRLRIPRVFPAESAQHIAHGLCHTP